MLEKPDAKAIHESIKIEQQNARQLSYATADVYFRGLAKIVGRAGTDAGNNAELMSLMTSEHVRMTSTRDSLATGPNHRNALCLRNSVLARSATWRTQQRPSSHQISSSLPLRGSNGTPSRIPRTAYASSACPTGQKRHGLVRAMLGSSIHQGFSRRRGTA